MSAGIYDFSWIRGNDAPPIKARFKDGNGDVISLTGSTIIYRALTGATEVINRTLTPDDDYVDFTPSLVESRLIPLGALTRYEIERRIDGTQQTLLKGTITGTDGVNSDD